MGNEVSKQKVPSVKPGSGAPTSKATPVKPVEGNGSCKYPKYSAPARAKTVGFFTPLPASVQAKQSLQDVVAIEQEQGQQLLKYVVNGQQTQAKDLLEEYSGGLLLIKARDHIFDPSGREIKGLTAWQAALYARDARMVAMIQEYFNEFKEIDPTKPTSFKVINGNHIRQEQTCEIFKLGYYESVDQQASKIFDFRAIYRAIQSAEIDDINSAIKLEGAIMPETSTVKGWTVDGDACTLTIKLNKFREQFTKHSLNERFYNPQHLLKAVQLYQKSGEEAGWINKGKLQVLWSQVVGFTQRFLPAWYAQAFWQGLGDLEWRIKMSDENEDELIRNDCSMPLVHHPENSKLVTLGFRYGINMSRLDWASLNGLAKGLYRNVDVIKGALQKAMGRNNRALNSSLSISFQSSSSTPTKDPDPVSSWPKW